MLCLFIRKAGVHYVVLYGSTTSDTFTENVLRFFHQDIKHGIAQLHSFSVISFIPVFTSRRLVKDDIVSAKNLSKKAGPNTRRLNREASEARFFGNWVNYLHKMTHAYRDMSPVNITLDLWTVFVYLVTVSSPITDRVCTHNTHTAAAV